VNDLDMLENFLHKNRTRSAGLDTKLTMDIETKKASEKTPSEDIGSLTETNYGLYRMKYDIRRVKPVESIYQKLTSMYEYTIKKIKDRYIAASHEIKQTSKKIVVKSENALRVLLRGFVRMYSVSSSGKMSFRVPYGKPHDPTREDLFYEMMAVHT
jgi:hypothetical protein